MTSENKNINDILALHFAGERLSDEQEKVLVNWVYQNKEEYQRLSDVFQTTEGSLHESFNLEQAWLKVNKKLSVPKTFRFYQLRNIFSYAACITLIFGLALYVINTNKDESNQYYNTTATIQTMILPDSSSVTLYPKAKISYLADMKKNERKTDLEGKAFFKIKPNPKKPFTVHNNGTAIRVLGTSFLVDGEKKNETRIFVREGTVQISTKKDNVILHDEEQALSDQNKIVKSKIEDPEAIFKNHILEKKYKGTPLSLVIRDIESEFKITMICPDSLMKAKINSKIKFVDVEEVLSEISYICNIKHRKITDKKYELYKLQ